MHASRTPFSRRGPLGGVERGDDGGAIRIGYVLITFQGHIPALPILITILLIITLDHVS